MIQDVEAAVIRPMRRRFRRPKEIPADKEEEALDYYRRGLQRFPRPILDQAWQAVVERWEFPFWPDLKLILEAAEALHKPEPQKDWLPEAERLRDEYVRKFMKTSTHAARAREAGYEPKLRQYVEAACWPQAQWLAGRKGTEYALLLFNWLPEAEREAEKERFYEHAAEQVRAGRIKVTIPLKLVGMWQREAEKVVER